MKLLQNRIAESRSALPVTSLIAIAVWAAAGLAEGQLVLPFACFVVTTYLMVELNNSNALIRIYSRTVSCSFLLLSCAACFTFASEQGAIAELCAVASYLTLFHTYQDRQSTGWTFYTFLCVGLASMVYVHILYYVPILWFLMLWRLSSLSLRTFVASLFGLATPYWIVAFYIVYAGHIDIAAEHFSALWHYGPLFDISAIGLPQVLVFALVVVLSATGTIHYLRTSYNDKIRIRMFYDCFITANIVTAVFLVLQPQHFDLLIRMLIINTSPMIAHFVALTHTRITNWAFCFFLTVTVAVTGYNLWTLL